MSVCQALFVAGLIRVDLPTLFNVQRFVTVWRFQQFKTNNGSPSFQTYTFFFTHTCVQDFQFACEYRYACCLIHTLIH